MQFEALSNALSVLTTAKTQLKELNQRLPASSPVAPIARQETEEERARNMEIRRFQKDIDDSTMKIEAQIRQLDNIQTLDLTTEFGLTTQAVTSGLSRNMRLLEERKMRAQSMLILEHYMESFRSRKVTGELEAAESWFNIQGRILKAELKSIGVDIGERDVTEEDILAALQSASENTTSAPMHLPDAPAVGDIAPTDAFPEASTFELRNSGSVVAELAEKCRAAQEAWHNAALATLQELQSKLNSEINSLNKKIRITESSISQAHRQASELNSQLQSSGINESGIRQSIEEKFQAVYQKFELYNHQQRSIMRDVEAAIEEDVKEVTRLRTIIYDLGIYKSSTENTEHIVTSKHIQHVQSVITATENSIASFEAKLAQYENWMNDLQFALEEVNVEIKSLQTKNRDLFTQNEQTLQLQQSEIAALRYQCNTLSEQLQMHQSTYNALHSHRAAEIKAAKVKARNSMRLSGNARLSSRAGQEMIQKARQAREKALASPQTSKPPSSGIGQKLLTAIGEMGDSDEEEEEPELQKHSSTDRASSADGVQSIARTAENQSKPPIAPIVPMFSPASHMQTVEVNEMPRVSDISEGNSENANATSSLEHNISSEFLSLPIQPLPPATPEGMFRAIDANNTAIGAAASSESPDVFEPSYQCSIGEAAYCYQLHQLAARKEKQKKKSNKKHTPPPTDVRPTFEVSEGLTIIEQILASVEETQCLPKTFLSTVTGTFKDLKREAPILRIDEAHARLRDLCTSILQSIITDAPTSLILQNKLTHFSILAVSLITIVGVILNCTVEDHISVPVAIGAFFEDYNHVLLQIVLQGGYLDPKKLLDFLNTSVVASRPQLEEVGYKKVIDEVMRWKDAVLCGAKLEVADPSWKYYSAFSSDNMSILQSEDRHAICSFQQLFYLLGTTSIQNISTATLPPLDNILQSSRKYTTPYRYISDVLSAALPASLPFLLVLELTRRCIEEEINKKTVMAKIALHDEDVAYMQFLNPNEALNKKSTEKIVNEHCVFETLRPKHKLFINDLKKEALSLSMSIESVIDQNRTLKLSKAQSEAVMKLSHNTEEYLAEVSDRNREKIIENINKFAPMLESLRDLRYRSLDEKGPILQPLIKKKETLISNLQSMKDKIRTNSIRVTTLKQQMEHEQQLVTTLAQHTQGLISGNITIVTPELESVLYEIENPGTVAGYEVTRSTAVATFNSQIEHLKDQIAAWKYSYHSLLDRQKRIEEGDIDDTDEELLASIKLMRSKQVGQGIICTLLVMILKQFNDGSLSDQRMNAIVGLILNMVGPPSTDDLGYQFLTHYLDALIAFDGTVMYDGEAFLRAFFSDNMDEYMEMLYRREEAASGKKRLRTRRIVASRQTRRLRTVSVEDGADVEALPRMRVASSGGTVQEVIPSRQSSRNITSTPSKDASRNNSMRHSPIPLPLEASPKPDGKSFLPPLTPNESKNTKGILRKSVNL